jgi:hypothetical protein
MCCWVHRTGHQPLAPMLCREPEAHTTDGITLLEPSLFQTPPARCWRVSVRSTGHPFTQQQHYLVVVMTKWGQTGHQLGAAGRLTRPFAHIRQPWAPHSDTNAGPCSEPALMRAQFVP